MMPKWTTKDITKLKRLYKQGLSINAIAEEMDRTTPATRGRVLLLQKAGNIPYRNRWKGIRESTPKSEKAETYYLSRTQKTGNEVETYHKAYVNKAPKSEKPTTAQKIQSECDQIKAFLIAKNLAYGDSALAPIRIFSQCDISEQIRVRIDDKLNRLLQGNASIETDEDIIRDLIGYFILLLVQMHDE